MSSMTSRPADRSHRYVPSAPLVVDPTIEPVSLEMVPVGPGGAALVPVLVVAGVRIYVDPFSADTDATRWWYDLGTAAMNASLCYPAGSGFDSDSIDSDDPLPVSADAVPATAS